MGARAQPTNSSNSRRENLLWKRDVVTRRSGVEKGAHHPDTPKELDRLSRFGA